MIYESTFDYEPVEFEKERSSYAYLISLLSFTLALPLPIINLVSTIVYYIANRRATYFIRWHAIQAIFTQLFMLPFNSLLLWWTVYNFHFLLDFTLNYWLYLGLVLGLNVMELVATIVTAIKVRKGIHVRWWIYGYLTDLFCSHRNKARLTPYKY